MTNFLSRWRAAQYDAFRGDWLGLALFVVLETLVLVWLMLLVDFLTGGT